MTKRRDEITEDVIRIIKNINPQLSPTNAWLSIYQILLWFESEHTFPFDALPHIIDANDLRQRKVSNPSSPKAWQRRAYDFQKYLAQNLGCNVSDVPDRCDLLMKLPQNVGLQRQNILGIAFISLILHLLKTFGSKDVLYKTEFPANNIFPGIKLPGRSENPSIDILVEKNDLPRTVISVKWSLRHDRIGDITSECPTYKSAALHRRLNFNYYVITNEFGPARLTKIITDNCVDAVFHVCKAAITEVANINGRMLMLKDLSELFDLTNTW